MKAILTLCFAMTSLFCLSQDMTKFKLYNPSENAEEGIKKAVNEASKSGKHVFIQIGGNWFVWCARFEDYVKSSKVIDSIIKADYVVYHLNYSKENENGKLLAKYGFPQRFGFPVFLVLNGKGELIHTENSAYLEEGKSYDYDKVKTFFLNWSPRALDPSQYREQ